MGVGLTAGRFASERGSSTSALALGIHSSALRDERSHQLVATTAPSGFLRRHSSSSRRVGAAKPDSEVSNPQIFRLAPRTRHAAGIEHHGAAQRGQP